MRLVSKHHPVSNSCNIVTGNVHVVGDNFPFDAPFFFFEIVFHEKQLGFLLVIFPVHPPTITHWPFQRGLSTNMQPIPFISNNILFGCFLLISLFAGTAFSQVCLMSTKKTHCSPYPSNIKQMGHGHYPLGGSSICRWTTILWLMTIP